MNAEELKAKANQNKAPKNPKACEEAETEIVDVWKDNLDEELPKLCALVEKGYNVIAMDTEFPGIIYTVTSQQMASGSTWYDIVRDNVNNLNFIQVGLSLSDAEGNMPTPINTWQFNLEFNLKKDKFSLDSITILKEAGIDFDKLEVIFWMSG